MGKYTSNHGSGKLGADLKEFISSNKKID